MRPVIRCWEGGRGRGGAWKRACLCHVFGEARLLFAQRVVMRLRASRPHGQHSSFISSFVTFIMDGIIIIRSEIIISIGVIIIINDLKLYMLLLYMLFIMF